MLLKWCTNFSGLLNDPAAFLTVVGSLLAMFSLLFKDVLSKCIVKK